MSDIKTINSETIFGNKKVVYIIHKDKRYVLRVTKDDKLILTK